MTPQPYQGLLVAAGQLVVENVGDYVQNVPAIATIVSADSGALVSDELQQTASPGLSLQSRLARSLDLVAFRAEHLAGRARLSPSTSPIPGARRSPPLFRSASPARP